VLHLLSTPLLQSVGVALGRLRSSDLRPLERLPIHGQVELASIANIVDMKRSSQQLPLASSGRDRLRRCGRVRMACYHPQYQILVAGALELSS
jgi:hypothetical protein